MLQIKIFINKLFVKALSFSIEKHSNTNVFITKRNTPLWMAIKQKQHLTALYLVCLGPRQAGEKVVDNLTISARKGFSTHLKGKYHGDFDHFVKNGEIRPSLGYKIILQQREERNQLSS